MCKDGDNISDGQGPHRTVTEVELELLSSLKSGFFPGFSSPIQLQKLL